MTLKITIATVLLAFGINSASAQTPVRASQQRHRIRQGVKSGELTKPEAAHLRHNQKEIHQEVKEAKSDGVVTKSEKKDIRQDKRKESRKIFRKKHNDRKVN